MLRVTALYAALAAGCYLEGTVGLTPTRTQQLTGFDMVTQENTQKAWTIGLATGFYFDVPYGGGGVSQWDDATTSGPSGNAETNTGGRHFFPDIHFSVSDAVPLPVTRSLPHGERGTPRP